LAACHPQLQGPSEQAGSGHCQNTIGQEIKAALKNMKNGKAAGMDMITTELLKLLEDLFWRKSRRTEIAV